MARQKCLGIHRATSPIYILLFIYWKQFSNPKIKVIWSNITQNQRCKWGVVLRKYWHLEISSSSLFSRRTSSTNIHYHLSFSFSLFLSLSLSLSLSMECPRGVMVKAMDCGIIVREFVLQSLYYVHFRGNILGERYEPPYPPSYGLNSTSTVLRGE